VPCYWDSHCCSYTCTLTRAWSMLWPMVSLTELESGKHLTWKKQTKCEPLRYFSWYTPTCTCAGLKQSMKPMIGKSIDQSMTIDALLVNWCQLASANRWPTDNHTKVVETHPLSSIGVTKILVSHQSSLYVYSFCSKHKCLRFEFVHQLIDWHW